MICTKCAKCADSGKPSRNHPKKCGCDCQHKNPGSWEGKK